MLLPSVDVIVDVAEFDELSRHAIAEGDPDAARAAIATQRYSSHRLERSATGETLRTIRVQKPAVDALVSELADLTRRQAVLLETLAGVPTAVRGSVDDRPL
jgi:hypothetical protein